jgi:hypothetical protein
MTQSSVFSSVRRTAGYFRGMRITTDKHLYVPGPDARVKLNGSFFRDVWTVTQLYTYLVANRVGRLARGIAPTGTIAFYPNNAPPWYNIWLVLQLTGLKVISDASKADYVFIFDDATHSDVGRDLHARSNCVAVNQHIEDISKQHVADIFEQVFGYSLSVDPTQYKGPAVRKSDDNGTHDGVIVDCPISPNEVLPGYAYQRLIDSTFNGKTSEDLRIAYVMGEIPVVFHKHKSLDKRFGTTYLSVDVRSGDDVFSAEETDLIAAYCNAIALDFGTVDVMRDKVDGRIYIVDVNKTGMPVMSLSSREQIGAMRTIAKTFENALVQRGRQI